MEKKKFTELLSEAIPQLKQGAFLVSGNEGNPMTIGWATFGIIWGKPICTVFVRQSRYSHELMEKNDNFTVSVPNADEMKKELAYCGSTSGRDKNKLAETGLTLQSIDENGKALSNCTMHFVCKTVVKAQLKRSDISEEILAKFYNTNQATADGDLHTVYFGEILDAYCE